VKTRGNLVVVQAILILGMNGQLIVVAALLPAKEPLVPIDRRQYGFHSWSAATEPTTIPLSAQSVTVLLGLNHSISCLYKVQLMECRILVMHVIFPSVLIIITNMFKV
jgi:hypothetical protein